jgi:hypothetical protein
LSTFLCFLYFILSNVPLVLKVKCAKFHQNRSKTVYLHTKQTFKQRSNLARFYGIVATLATTRKAMEGRTKPTYVVIGRSGLSIYPIYVFSLWSRVLTPVLPDQMWVFSEVSPHYHIVACLISQIRRMLGPVPPSFCTHPHRTHPESSRQYG